jgi:hypothetical protein
MGLTARPTRFHHQDRGDGDASALADRFTEQLKELIETG